MLDVTEAIEKAGGNTELAKELFGMLLQELPLLRDQLLNAIEKADQPAIWDHTHKIYGSTAYCGVPVLRQAASAMETAVKARELEAIRHQFESLDAAIQQLLSQGSVHLAKAW